MNSRNMWSTTHHHQQHQYASTHLQQSPSSSRSVNMPERTLALTSWDNPSRLPSPTSPSTYPIGPSTAEHDNIHRYPQGDNHRDRRQSHIPYSQSYSSALTQSPRERLNSHEYSSISSYFDQRNTNLSGFALNARNAYNYQRLHPYQRPTRQEERSSPSHSTAPLSQNGSHRIRPSQQWSPPTPTSEDREPSSDADDDLPGAGEPSPNHTQSPGAHHYNSTLQTVDQPRTTPPSRQYTQCPHYPYVLDQHAAASVAVLLAANDHMSVCPGIKRNESYPSPARTNEPAEEHGSPSGDRSVSTRLRQASFNGSPARREHALAESNQGSDIEKESARALVEMSQSMGVLNASPMRQSPAHQSTVTVLPVTPTQPVHHHQNHQHHHQSPQQQRHQSQSDAHGPQRVTAQNWDREPSATPSDATPETPEPPRTRRRDSRCNALTEQRSLTGAIRNTRSANGHASTSAEPQPRRKNTMDERERKRMLEEDEWTGSVETHSVVCMGCKRKVSLDKRSRYYPGLWTKHRGKCMEIKRLMAVKNAPSGEAFGSAERDEAPRRRASITRTSQSEQNQQNEQRSPARRSNPYQLPGDDGTAGRRVATGSYTTQNMAVLHLEGGAELQSAFREEVPSRLRPRQDSYEAGGLDYYLLGPRYSDRHVDERNH